MTITPNTPTTPASLLPNSLGGATSAASTASSSASSTNSLSATESDFLSLLIAQLKNQDPTSPMDSSTFVTQLAELNNVQAVSQTNQLMTQLLAQGQASANANLTSYVGDQVTVQSNAISLTSGGSVTFGYTMPANTSGTIVIKDSSGNQVFSTAADPTAGNQTYTWNGKNSAGTALPAGNYTVTVNTGSGSTASTAQTYTAATITAVDTSGSTPEADLSTGAQVPFTSIMTNSGKASSSTN